MDLVQALENGFKSHSRLALVTLVEVKGSVPQTIGAKMLVAPTGERIWGTVGGGKIEFLVISDATQCLAMGKSTLKNYLLDVCEATDSSQVTTGMACGGETKVFIDIIGNYNQAIIFGGGHIGQKVTPLLQELDFYVTIVESREDYAKKELSGANKCLIGVLPDILNQIAITPQTYIIIVTHSHTYDEKVLDTLLHLEQQPWKYLGMIGSQNKIKEIFGRLEEKGIAKSLLANVHAPIGIPLGRTHTPMEIAVSIVAEIIKERNK